MATFIAFTEGKNELMNNGLPTTCYFLLSTRGVGAGTQHAAGDTLAGDALFREPWMLSFVTV